MKHSNVVGGSSCGRLIACPPSRELSRDFPNKGSDYANEGSMLHAVMEQLMINGLRSNASMLGFESHGVTFTSDHLDCVDQANDDFNEIADCYNIEEFATEPYASWGDVLPGAFGSIDVLGTGPTHNLVLDWKFGQGVRVNAEELPQGMFYAVAAGLDPSLRAVFNPELPTVIAVVQPRIADATNHWIATPERLKAFQHTLVAADKAATAGTGTLNMGSHCRWCPAQVKCPAKLGLVRDLPVLDNADMGEALRLADAADAWVKVARKTALEQAEKGNVPDGYKLVAKTGRRAWVDPSEAEIALRGRGYWMKVSEICDRVLKTAPQVEKILKAQGKTLPEGTVSKVSSGVTLVKDTDKRAAILPLANAFNEIGKMINDK